MVTFIEKIIKGDSYAITKFYKDFSPRLFAYLQKRLPRNEDGEDILNEVFFEAIDSLPLLKKTENISSWLYAIAHNKVVDFYRKRKIKSLLLSQLPFLDIIAKEFDQPEFQYEKGRIREKIEKTLHALSSPYKKILQLHYEEKIPVKRLAPIFNLSFKATESLLFRARQSFKKAYGRT